MPALIGGVVDEEEGAGLAGAAPHEEQRVSQRGCGRLRDGLEDGRTCGRGKPEPPLSAGAGQLVTALPASEILIDGVNGACRWLDTGDEGFCQQGQPLTQLQHLEQGRAFAVQVQTLSLRPAENRRFIRQEIGR